MHPKWKCSSLVRVTPALPIAKVSYSWGGPSCSREGWSCAHGVTELSTSTVATYTMQSSGQEEKPCRDFCFINPLFLFVSFLHKSSKDSLFFFLFYFSLNDDTFQSYGALILPQVTESCNNVNADVFSSISIHQRLKDSVNPSNILF